MGEGWVIGTFYWVTSAVDWRRLSFFKGSFLVLSILPLCAFTCTLLFPPCVQSKYKSVSWNRNGYPYKINSFLRFTLKYARKLGKEMSWRSLLVINVNTYTGFFILLLLGVVCPLSCVYYYVKSSRVAVVYKILNLSILEAWRTQYRAFQRKNNAWDSLRTRQPHSRSRFCFRNPYFCSVCRVRGFGRGGGKSRPKKGESRRADAMLYF